MKASNIEIKTKTKKYSIIVGTNIIKDIGKILNNKKIFFEKCLVVADKNIPKKFKTILFKNLKSKKKFIYELNPSEKNKNSINIDKIHNILFKNKFNRDDCLISFGGGIVGDVVGFASSTFKRGIKFINIPSTLLSQVDSSIGGKTGINNKYGKNLIGSFYQPELVISDIKILNSLPYREIICGYAEILKSSLINGYRSFNFLDKNLNSILKLKRKYLEKAILESCKVKKQIIERDEKELNLRKSLNLGHTFGHAYEATLNYSKRLNHGEGVLYGILSATKLSKKLKILKKGDYKLILSHLSKLNFINLNKFFKKRDTSKIVRFMTADKKNTSKKINFVTLKRIGKVSADIQLNTNKVKGFFELELLK